jgi:tRNA(Arg) A34 adenosine deaminase TadA
MDEALLLAKQAVVADEVPVGAIIVDPQTNKIIATAHNQTEQLKDPTAHAEILAIREACRILDSNKIPELDLYVTLEPCAMCASAIANARIKRLYFGAYDSKSGAVENGARIFDSSSCHHQPEIYGGIAEEQCGALLKEFFAGKR